MSTYLDMWKRVNDLSKRQTAEWLAFIGAPKGKAIQFRGINVLDVDLVEALKFHYNDF